jgi:sugar lactone lactonase YvrE
MKLFFVLTVLLSFLGKSFSDEAAPVVATLYSGPVSPVGIWSDAKGNIYGCETSFHSVFKITAGGVKTDFAGTRGTAGVASEGVLALNALFNSPRAVWGDGQFLYVTDSANNRIRRVSWTTSLVTTVVGGGTGSILTSGSFPGTSVALPLPNAIAGSSNGKIYFADFGRMYVLDTETGLVGTVSFIAGGGDRIGTFAHGSQVSLKNIQGLAVDPTNSFLFVADSGNKVVREIDLKTYKSIIFAGRAKRDNFVVPVKPFENGVAAHKMKFGNPSSVWVGDDGSVFIADSLYHTISVVRHNRIYLFAGKWSSGAISNTLMTGPANQVQIEASHIFGDSSKGVLYLSDATRGGIQQVSPLTVNVYAPTAAPTVPLTNFPSVTPIVVPSAVPTVTPTPNPTQVPTKIPSKSPTQVPTSQPTSQPTVQPTSQPTGQSTNQPSGQPTSQPSQPTGQPSSQPTSHPTLTPPPLITKTNLDTRLSEPSGVWVDANGNVYVSNNDWLDDNYHQIYKQSAADGAVSVFAGAEGVSGFAGDNGPAIEAKLATPIGLWGDSDNLYICDSDNGRVRAVNFATNIITTITGEVENIGGDSQLPTASTFYPISIWGDGEGSLYILTSREVLVYSIADKSIQLLAYSDSGAQETGADGKPVAFLDLPRTMSLQYISGDASRNCLYVSEFMSKVGVFSPIIRKLDLTTKTATIFAGQFEQYSSEPYTDGALATEIKFSNGGPAGLWTANDGTVFVVDYGAFTISAINPDTKEIHWFAGTWNDGGPNGLRADQDVDNELNINGSPKLGKFHPYGLAGNSRLNTLYVTDYEHSAVRKISPLFTTPTPPWITKTNLDSSLYNPAGVWVDLEGNVFVVNNDLEKNNHQIYKQSAVDGTVSVVAGAEGEGFSGDDGPATEALFATPYGIWGDSDNLYICDTDNGRVRAVNFVTNIITTIVGGGGNEVTMDLQPAKDVSFSPLSVWGDGQESLYILTNRELLLYIIADKTVQLLAYSDSGAQKTGEDGKPVAFLDLIRQSGLQQISGDSSRKCLYITEETGKNGQSSPIIRKLDLESKTATIFAGQLNQWSADQYTDGSLATDIRFSSWGPSGLWVANDGTVFVSDAGTSSISAINPNTNEIRWFAGTWNDLGPYGRADQDVHNDLNMNGPAKLGRFLPHGLAGDSQLNTLYLSDYEHSAVRKISLLFTSPAPAAAAPAIPAPAAPDHRKLLEEKKVLLSSGRKFSPRVFEGKLYLRGSV